MAPLKLWDRVRYFDQPDRDDCYHEGILEGYVETPQGLPVFVIKVQSRVWGGRPVTVRSLETHVYPDVDSPKVRKVHSPTSGTDHG